MSGNGSTTATFRWVPISVVIAMLYVLAGAAALVYTKTTLRAPDEFEYLSIGQNIAKHGLFSMDGISPTAWRAPGLPMLVAILWLIWPSVYLIKLFTVGCWMATGFVIARLAAYFHGTPAGHLAALLYLCYIFELYAATTLYPQTIAGFLVAVSVAAVVLPEKLSLRRQILLGTITAFQILMIPNCVAVAAATYTYAVLRSKIRLRAAIAAAAVTVVMILTWCNRNERTIGGFIFTTTIGITLYDGNRDNVTAASVGSPEDSDIKNQVRGLSEIDVDKLFRRKAVDWIAKHPWQTVGLSLEKFFYWFEYENKYETQIGTRLINLLSLVAAIVYYPTLVGALMAIRSGNRGARDFTVLVWSIYLAGAFTYVLFVTRIRYRLPFDGLFFAAAAGKLLELVRGRKIWSLLKFRQPGRIPPHMRTSPVKLFLHLRLFRARRGVPVLASEPDVTRHKCNGLL